MVVDPYPNFFSALNSLFYKSNKGKLLHYFLVFSFLFLFWFLMPHPVYLKIFLQSVHILFKYILLDKLFCDIFDNTMFFRRHNIVFISWYRSLRSSSNMSLNTIINCLSYTSKTQKHSFFSIYTCIVFKNSFKVLILKAPNSEYFELLELPVAKTWSKFLNFKFLKIIKLNLHILILRVNSIHSPGVSNLVIHKVYNFLKSINRQFPKIIRKGSTWT